MQYLFVRGSNKKQRRGRIFSYRAEGETFSSLISTKCSLGILSQCGPPSCTLAKKAFLSLQFGKEQNISGNSIERRVYLFFLKIDRVFPVVTGKVGIGQ